MIGRILNEKYEITGYVGSGGMANVYTARRLEDGIAVAIKVLKDEYAQDEAFRSQFHREEQAARRLHHPNIVSTVDMGEDDGRSYIVLEYIKGKTLKQLILERGRLSVEEAVHIAIQLCDAVKHAHDRGLIHRDIKPQNVLIDETGTVKLSDFGIAKAVSSATATLNNGSVLGSVQYASPEQARSGYVDATSDIYSLGIVLYEMTVGKLPFEGDSAVTIALKHIQESVIPPRALRADIPRTLECVILKAVEKNRERRYQNAADMAADLKHVLADPNGDWLVWRGEELDSTRSMKIPVPPQEQEQPRPAAKRKVTLAEAFIGVLKVLVTLVVLAGVLLTVDTIVKAVREQKNKPETVLIPTLEAELTQEEAAAELRNAGFIPQVVEQANNAVPQGQIIATVPEGGTAAHKGSTVQIFVSLGPEEIFVPALTGMTESEAMSELSALGLTGVIIAYEYDPNTPGGYVTFQDPAPEAPLYQGDEVSMIVSVDADDRIVAVTDVTGRTLSEARKLLTNQRFTPALVITKRSSAAVDTVYSQSPAGSSEAPIGSNVTLWVSSGEQNNPTKVELYMDVTLNTAQARIKVQMEDEFGQIFYLYDELMEAGEYCLVLDVSDYNAGIYNVSCYYDDRQASDLEVQLPE